MHAHDHTSVLELLLLLVLVIVLLLLLLLLLSEGKGLLPWLTHVDTWREDGNSNCPLSEPLKYSVKHGLGFLGRDQPIFKGVDFVVVSALLVKFCLVVLCEVPRPVERLLRQVAKHPLIAHTLGGG
jgi:hypothetical protein